MSLFVVDRENGEVHPQPEGKFADLGVLEREHIEAWVASAPEILGDRLVVVATEFDRFAGARERIDVLAVTTTTSDLLKLVVVELKRGDRDLTLDLQAIKYAAYCSRFGFADVCRAYATPNEGLDAARRRLRDALEWPDNELDPVLDDRPAIILVAPGFRVEVVTTVRWLIEEFDVPISCVKLTPYELDDGRLLLTSERVLPLSEGPVVGPRAAEDDEGVAGGAGPAISRKRLRELVAAIPPGRWVSYGDLAWALGRPKAALPVGGMIAADQEIQNAHRVLHASGAVPPGFRTAEGKGPEEAIARWAAEGVQLKDEKARVPQSLRWPRGKLSAVPSGPGTATTLPDDAALVIDPAE